MNKFKADRKGIVQDARKQDKWKEKENITFRLPKALIKELKTQCEKDDVTPTFVLERLLASYVGWEKGV